MQNPHKTLTTARFSLAPMVSNNAQQLADLGADPEVVKNLVFDWSTAEQRLEIAKFWIDCNQDFGIWGGFDVAGAFGPPNAGVGFCAAEEPLPRGGDWLAALPHHGR